MNKDSTRVLKETYDEQKPIYDLYKPNDFSNRFLIQGSKSIE